MSRSNAGFVSGLAAFSGIPCLDRTLHVGCPNIPDRETVLARVGAALDRRWLSNDGPMVREFEELVEERLGVRHCVAVSSGTQGLAVAAHALGLHGEVVVPAFTFIATAHALAWQGIKPVFCDVDRDTHQLDSAAIEAVLTDSTTGILAAHTWGRPGDIDGITDMATRFNLDLLFDAAPAFGASYRGMPVGNFGRVEILSFHATKVVNCGEGGAIVTNDDDVASAARMMRTFGFVDNDRVQSIGTNAKMSELAAAMGICSLECYDDYLQVNQRNFDQYRAALEAVPGITVLPCPPDAGINFNNVVIEIDPERTGVERDLVLDLLTAEQILVRRYFWPGCHRMEPYRSQKPPSDADFPFTDAIASRVLSLPTGTSIEPADIERVCELLAGIVEHGHEATERSRRLGSMASGVAR